MYEVATVEIFSRVFGAALGAVNLYRPAARQEADNTVGYTIEEIEEAFQGDIKSSLGTPIVMPVRFLPGRYQERLVDGTVNFVDYDEYIVPFASLFTVEQPKVVRSTATVGGREVIEWIGESNPLIDFRGLIINTEGDAPPEAGIRAFQQITSVPAALQVECEFLTWHGIDQLVVQHRRTFQIEGYSHVVGFHLACMADTITEARLRNDL